MPVAGNDINDLVFRSRRVGTSQAARNPDARGKNPVSLLRHDAGAQSLGKGQQLASVPGDAVTLLEAVMINLAQVGDMDFLPLFDQWCLD